MWTSKTGIIWTFAVVVTANHIAFLDYFSGMQSSQYAVVQNVIYYLFYHFLKKSSLDTIITH